MTKQMNKVAESPKKKQLNIHKSALVLLAGLILSVFINNSLSLYLGPILAVLFVYLFFTGYSELVTAVIIVANDALGTILMGSVSFPYLLFLLVAYKLLNKRSFEKRILLFGAICMLFAGQLFLVGFINARALIYAMIYVVAIASINPGIDSLATRKFFAGVAFAVVLVAVHATVTGGVEFYELHEGSEQILRKGVLGVGIGDSNFSGFLLNVGVLSLWYFTSFRKSFKLLLTLPILYSIVLTQSVSALLTLLIIILFSILFMEKKSKAIVVLCVAAIFAVLLYQVYMGLPQDMHITELDAYIGRVEEKLFSLSEGDYSSVTTLRSDLATGYLKYIFFEQGTTKTLFGGNGLLIESVSEYAPHNTFISVLLQFGVAGFILFYGYALGRGISFYNNKTVLDRKAMLVLKIVCLFMATNLTLYGDNLWAIWMMVLLL